MDLEAWVRRTFKEKRPLLEVVDRRFPIRRRERRRREPRSKIPHPHLRPPRARLRPAPPPLAPLGERRRGVLPVVAAWRRRLARFASALASLADTAAGVAGSWELLRRWGWGPGGGGEGRER